MELGAASDSYSVTLRMAGSYMGGASIGVAPGRPLLFSSSDTLAVWIMCYCDGSALNMVQLLVTVTAGGIGRVRSSAAGYTPSTCTTSSLTEASVFTAWNARTVVNVASCDTCDGLGVRSLVYSFPGND